MLLPVCTFGTMRMSAIIHNLKNKHGMDIETEMKTSPAGVRYASYQLANYSNLHNQNFSSKLNFLLS